MERCIYPEKIEMGAQAAQRAAALLCQAIEQRGAANLILATGTSQFEMLSALVKLDVDWSKVTAFHLAFNDPPADFETQSPYIVVNLDEPAAALLGH